MATLQVITNNAFRELGITAVGDSPEGTEYSEGFALLQAIASTMFGYEMGENLTDINVGSSTNLNSSAKALDATSEITSLYIPNNVRVNCNLTAPLTLYLHPKPREGDRVVIRDAGNNFTTNNVTIKGNGRNIATVGTQTITLNTSGVDTAYFFRADTGMWIAFDVSADTLQSPYPSSFDDMLSLMLAKRLAPRYGATWQPTQEEALDRLVKTFRSRFRQEQPTNSEWALVRLPSVGNSYNYFATSNNFDKGFAP